MPWVDIIRGCLKAGDCVLSMTNSTTLEGQLRKTNFSELGDKTIQALVRLKAERMHAMKYMTTGIREYSQWFKGEDNVVADSLSCNYNWSDEELTQFFCTHCPSQIPPQIQDSTPAQQNYLVADCVAAPVACEGTVQQKIHNDQSWSRKRWTEYCGWIGLSDPFLDNIPTPQGSNSLAHLP
jgi:hypothetical protein